jgi:hypothetical protein
MQKKSNLGPATSAVRLFRNLRSSVRIVAPEEWMDTMANQTSRGRKRDRTRVAGGEDYEVRYESKKTGRSKGQVKRGVKKVGNSRKRVEQDLRG